MPDIIETIAENNRRLVLYSQTIKPLSKVRGEAFEAADRIFSAHKEYAFEKALAAPQMSFICECKKASPSKGIIAPNFPYLDIAREYEQAGAAAISVLTEPRWFLGSVVYLRQIASQVSVPCLRKDFVIDEYMIYEAVANGASAVLLICALLDEVTLRDYIQICRTLNISALVEAHDESEALMALRAGARIIGVNNRNLKDFSVDSANCLRLRQTVGDDAIFVAESGIRSRSDVELLERSHVDAVLIGEAVMRAENKTEFLNSLRIS